MEETGEKHYDWEFDLNDDELMAELAGRFHASNAGQGGHITVSKVICDFKVIHGRRALEKIRQLEFRT